MPTAPRQFRLTDETMAELSRIARHLAEKTGGPCSAAAAVRAAVRDYVRRLDRRKKTEKNTP